MKKIDRTGEKNINNFESEMVIIKYRKNNDIDVYFPEYDWIAKNRRYQEFKNGKIKCPYEPSVYKIGYLGEGKYKISENGKKTRVYKTWSGMLQRCYDEKIQEKHPTYIGCKVCDEWLNFQNFAKWYEGNYYEVDSERMELDKDILIKHNKIYSPETCVYVPQTINLLFTKKQNNRGGSVIGATTRENGKYTVHCTIFNPETGKSKIKHLGVYSTQEKAFEVYKYYKEKNIKIVADYYENKIPNKLYLAMYNYEVEITD